MAERYLGHEMLVVGPGIRTGMPLRYDNPREIGADRLVNAVAAYDRLGGPCVVVDFGTAITYDPVSADGEYLGGIISPGVEISLEALTERAATLPKIDVARAALADRQDDDRRDPLGDRLRLRRPGRRDPRAACATSSAATAQRSPPAAWPTRSCPSAARSTDVDDLLTLTGLRLLHERQPLRAARMAVSFTVVIPTHDRRRRLEIALGGVRAQTRPPDQVIVVADGCTDGTSEAVRELGDEGLELLDLPKAPRLGWGHRNLAVQRARGGRDRLPVRRRPVAARPSRARGRGLRRRCGGPRPGGELPRAARWAHGGDRRRLEPAYGARARARRDGPRAPTRRSATGASCARGPAAGIPTRPGPATSTCGSACSRRAPAPRSCASRRCCSSRPRARISAGAFTTTRTSSSAAARCSRAPGIPPSSPACAWRSPTPPSASKRSARHARARAARRARAHRGLPEVPARARDGQGAQRVRARSTTPMRTARRVPRARVRPSIADVEPPRKVQVEVSQRPVVRIQPVLVWILRSGEARWGSS